MTKKDLQKLFEVLDKHKLGLVRYSSGGHEELSPYLDDDDYQKIIDSYNADSVDETEQLFEVDSLDGQVYRRDHHLADPVEMLKEINRLRVIISDLRQRTDYV